jgi:hypothetical protein
VGIECSDVEGTNVLNVKLYCFKIKWSELSYVEVYGDKINMHFSLILYWGFLIVLWLFY